MKPIVIIAAVSLFAAVSGSVHAQTAKLNEIDKDFMKSSSQSNLEEVQFAPTVASHAADPQMKQYGQKMKTDHAAAQKSLKGLAAQVHYTLPKSVTSDQKGIMEELAKRHGSNFDAAYKQEMIRDHTSDLQEVSRELSLGENPLVIANAKKSGELLEMHLKMANALPGPQVKK